MREARLVLWETQVSRGLLVNSGQQGLQGLLDTGARAQLVQKEKLARQVRKGTPGLLAQLVRRANQGRRGCKVKKA